MAGNTGCPTGEMKLRLPIREGPPLNGKIITVLVGEEEEPYAVHEDLVRKSSSFFEACMSNDWKEEQERIVKLPEQKPESFLIYSQWLYTGLLFITKEGEEERTTDPETGKDITHDNEWPRLKECYALGDYVQDSNFKDAVMDGFIDKMNETERVPFHLPEYIYPYSISGSPHRILVLDITMSAYDRSFFHKLTGASVPCEFFTDFVPAVGQVLGTGKKIIPIRQLLGQKQRCDHHEHTKEGKPCYKTRHHLPL